MSKSIVVTVEETGEVKIEAVGFRGASCDKATEALERALGIVGKKQRKPEYHIGNAQGQKVQQ